jgi:HlyD family secretion protein
MSTPLYPVSFIAGGTPRPGGGRAFRTRRFSRWVLMVSAVICLLIFTFALLRGQRAKGPAIFLTGVVTRGPLRETVRATGTVQPVSQVQVGAQVSGRIIGVRVDYNSRVNVGDLLGEIDPVPYRAQVEQARASLLSGRAQLELNRANAILADQNLIRQRRLRDERVNAPAELDSAVASAAAAAASVQVAMASVSQAHATLTIAQANLNYTRILAPINGTIASRSVDPGQTVAASFQTPTLFVIANDLSRMQVVANVAEANVGRLSEEMAATARVDAFPREVFHGRLSQLRISPNTTNGVVTYQAVIDISNPQHRLRPGMTATITVITAQRADVLRVPNAALRYQPGVNNPTGAGPHSTSGSAGRPIGPAFVEAPVGATRPGGPPDSKLSGGPPSVLAPADDDGDDRGTWGSVYIAKSEGGAVRLSVSVGITDGTQTEIEGPGIAAGQQVVLDETATQARPRGPGGPRMF